MKNLFLVLVLLLLTSGCNKNVKEEKIIEEPIIIEEEKYVDDNPIVVGLYDDKDLITIYYTNKVATTDIIVPTVYYTNEEHVDSSNVKYTFKKYYENYENIEKYKIGYHISYSYNGEHFETNILNPSIMFQCPGLFIYLYDEVHQLDGAWYSHVEENEVTDETIFDTIKLFMTDTNIDSDIELTAFTYDSDDFDENGNYRGNSKYTVLIKFN